MMKPARKKQPHALRRSARELTYNEMVDKVAKRGGDFDLFEGYDPTELRRFMKDNSAVPGPGGLWRRAIDKEDRPFQHCIGHGDGTWDLCVGDFS